MPVAEKPAETQTTHEGPELDQGTYEVLRNRLRSQGKELQSRLNRLHAERKSVFGSVDLALIGTERITTDHNCIPRDVVVVGSRLIFGYNVQFGLKTETAPSDVFSVYAYADRSFSEQPLDLIGDPEFDSDFRDLYRYYKECQFVRFATIGPFLFMVFQVGKSVGDIKTLKWSVEGGRLVYIDNRSDHECRPPPQHEFEWVRTDRSQHHGGEHPHISIDDRIFVETVGGDLTIKIENNTKSGEGIYSEEVDNADQTLDDAEFYYALLGHLIVLKIRPYQEQDFRYIVYNEKLQQAHRIDAIHDSCVLLPEDHGIIFSNGFYLQSGEHKTFDSDLQNMQFDERLASPNGEDYLYVFYNPDTGAHVLLSYNIIDQQLDTPVTCHGFAFFENGELTYFKAQDTPQKHHAMQIWQTPYVGENFVRPVETDSYLHKIGNRDLVRGMAECHEVVTLSAREESYAGLYVDIVKRTGDVLDAYFWLEREEAFNLREVLEEIRDTATAAVNEYDKVVQVRRNTKDQVDAVTRETRDVLKANRHRRYQEIGDFVQSLADLRGVRGRIISLKDLRYVDLSTVETLEDEIGTEAESVAGSCVRFLLRPEALAPYAEFVAEQKTLIESLEKVSDAKRVEEQVAAQSEELELLVETVSNLKIEDATQRTEIIDRISAIFSTLNQVRASLRNKREELASVEGAAEFGSQLKLLNQAVVNYLDICDTPEKCEDYLTKVMVQIEELDGKFAEFDDFIVQLAEKREEIYNAFESRKMALVEKRNRKAAALQSAADRILKGIQTRVDNLETVDAINGFFASDLLIEKVRDIVRQLGELDDSVKVDDIQSRLKTVKEDAVRQLKDRQDLYDDGGNVIRLGNHRFSVNVQALDLTTVTRDGELHFHLTGTNFFERVADEELRGLGAVRDQEVLSESAEVYRGEYLAYSLLRSLRDPDAPSSSDLLALDDDAFIAHVQRFAGPRYNEGYVKGVHDHDAAKLFRTVLELHERVGLLRYHTRARALARVYWSRATGESEKQLATAKLVGLAKVLKLFPQRTPEPCYLDELREGIEAYTRQADLFSPDLVSEASEYLYHQLMDGGSFVVSREAAELYRDVRRHLKTKKFRDEHERSTQDLGPDWTAAYRLQKEWVLAFLGNEDSPRREYVEETAALLLEGDELDDGIVEESLQGASVACEISDLLGSHPLIQGGRYTLDYPRFLLKMGQFVRHTVPAYVRYVELKKKLTDDFRKELKLDEFRPRVLTSFVRNRLIDEVYLSIVGDNLAKQMGVVGEEKRTDLMGLLLLISPPGYGKTTLMEYIANRLGLIFMKINGPAIGHQVTSLDPSEAPNAAAREELEKLNLALEMGDNVMIYLDDIQHSNPELLQKFISLCDGQRKIEGVYKGQTRTYDLRGRKVAVVMAGNPYTESGEKFQIPDMLANRADTYNLGEIVGDSEDAFVVSYLENALTSNPVLNQLATKSREDVHAIIKMAESESREGIDLEGNYSAQEIEEMVATMRKLLRVRDVILKVNQEYIRSAGQSDEFRTEPPFKLQGSYRNMNRIAEKVLPVLNDRELEALIFSNYLNDAQTLTSGSESNLLKFKELTDSLSPEDERRWNDIRKTYQRNVMLGSAGGDDQFAQVILQLTTFREGLDGIRETLAERSPNELVGFVAALDGIRDALTSRPPLELDGFKEGLDGIRNALESRPPMEMNGLKECLEGIGEVLASRPAAADSGAAAPAPAVSPAPPAPAKAAPGAAPYEIRVVNKIPQAFVQILEQQFRFMESWVQSLHQATTMEHCANEKLRADIGEVLSGYELLMRRLRGSPEVRGQ